MYNHHVTNTDIEGNWKSSINTSFKFSSKSLSEWYTKKIQRVQPEPSWSQVKQIIRDRFAPAVPFSTHLLKLHFLTLLYKESFKDYVDRFSLTYSQIEGYPDSVPVVTTFYATLPTRIRHRLYTELSRSMSADCTDPIPDTWEKAIPILYNLSGIMNPLLDEYYGTFSSISDYRGTIQRGKESQSENLSKKRGSEDLDFDKSKRSKLHDSKHHGRMNKYEGAHNDSSYRGENKDAGGYRCAYR